MTCRPRKTIRPFIRIQKTANGKVYYYATFYAPYDVLLPIDGEHTYNAFVCKKWHNEGMLRPGNVYNLQGRCVATEEMVKDGTWKNSLTPGVYIMSGKKIIVK